MKRLLMLALPLILSCFLLTASKEAKASHAAGGEIIYIHISDSTYQIFFKFYRDCTGISEPGTASLCIYNNCTNQTFTRTMNKWTGTLPPDNRANGSPVSAGCSQYPNKCINTSSPLPGYREWWYSHIETLPLKCNSWRYSVSINARNGSQNITGGNLYIETIFNSTISWVNSSPFYSIKPIPYVCINQQFTYNNGARDSDGDSLYTELMRPLTSGSCTGPATQVGLQTTSPAINFTNNPFQTGGTFQLTGGTGQMNFQAAQLGQHALSVRTREYRNGQEIGSIMRDVQVQVISCSTLPPSVDTPLITGGGQLLNGQIAACIGQKLDFCFDIESNDPDAILLAEDNLASSIPAATMTYSNLGNDSIRVCFSWIPAAADAGKTHSFQITIKDSTCKPPGILLQYVRDVSIYVWDKIEASPDTNICLGEPIFLGVSGGGNYQWTVLAGNDPSGFPKTGPGPIGQPTATTTYQVVSTINNYCPNSNKDTVIITVEQGPAINGQPDTTTCPDNPIDLDVNIVTQTGVKYTVKWTPATGLSSDTIPNPTVKIKNDRGYYVEVGSDQNRCKTLDTVVVTILDGFSIENPDTAICQGEVVKIRGKGDPLYGYLWESKDDPGAAYNPQASIIPTEIGPADTGKHFYTLTGKYPNCPDSVTGFTITVEPNPTVQVDNDASMCYGDTMQMHGVVSPASFTNYIFTWTPGASLNYPNQLDPIFSATSEGTTTLTLEAKTPEAGCASTASVNLTVFPADFLLLPNDTAICPGDTMTIAMNIGGEPSFYWAPDFNISSVSSQQPRVWPVADQKFIVYGKDSTGCLDTNEITIRVRPRAVMEVPDTVTLYPGESYRMDPAGNCLYYSWFPPLGLSYADVANPLVKPDVNTRYIVQGRTDAGCSVVDSVDVIVMNDSYIDIPNAFTPHTRGGNNTLKIKARGDVNLKRFEVYNRWGTKVYESTDVNEGWDGTYNGQLQPMGVYIYSIEAVTPSGKTVTKQGNVTLIQ
ncbi:MAG: gliding motility-associated C-terminal domain-containing protein [Chitinophagales bacterium]|nr:gliding motility-associated C-terminal domain-containing protein [Chitinophagales bacterium]